MSYSHSPVQAAAGDEQQTDIIALLPIVNRVASKMARNLPSYVSRDDLISLGTLGLMDAMRRYDPNKGVKLETFVTWRIRGAILDGLREMDPVPRQVRENAREIENAYLALETAELRTPNVEELCTYLNISEKELHRRLYDISRAVTLSLDVPGDPSGEENYSIIGVLTDPLAKGPEDEALKHEMVRTLADVVDSLPEKERLVVTLYYYEELSFKEIASILSLTVSRISQLHSKAIERLRSALHSRNQDR